MAIQFAVLASGSQGNSTLVRGPNAGLLIDVGMGPRALSRRLESVGSNWSGVAAVALTHIHGDHVDTATLSELARRRVAFHCHEEHRSGLAADSGFQMLEQAGLILTYDDRPFLTSTGLRIEPIRLRHDGGATFGFRVEVPSERRGRSVSIGYVADTGCWSEAMVESLSDVDVLGVEFNHDVTMQKCSGRSWVLIRRNLGDQGHLSNDQGAELVQAVLSRSKSQAVRHLVLLHLSQQCNQPDLAVQTARDAIRAAGRRVVVHAARQSPAHPNLWVHPVRRTVRSTGLGVAGSRPARRKAWPSDLDGSLGLAPPFRSDDVDGDSAGTP